MRFVPIALCLLMAACAPVVVTSQQPAPTAQPTVQPPVQPAVQPQTTAPRLSRNAAVNNFAAVVRTVEPVAERVCRQQTTQVNCDFRIVVDDRPGQPANAYQTVDRSGRPIIAFTVPLIVDARNRDELAFVMSHEAAHHIRGHLERQQRNATVGAIVFGQLAGALGAGGSVEAAQQIGATVGARSYSKEFELEADALGTRITALAGYDPLKGAQFFFRIPDPGDRFLGTHPANADRLRTVQRVAAGL